MSLQLWDGKTVCHVYDVVQTVDEANVLCRGHRYAAVADTSDIGIIVASTRLIRSGPCPVPVPDPHRIKLQNAWLRLTAVLNQKLFGVVAIGPKDLVHNPRLRGEGITLAAELGDGRHVFVNRHEAGLRPLPKAVRECREHDHTQKEGGIQ